MMDCLQEWFDERKLELSSTDRAIINGVFKFAKSHVGSTNEQCQAITNSLVDDYHVVINLMNMKLMTNVYDEATRVLLLNAVAVCLHYLASYCDSSRAKNWIK